MMDGAIQKRLEKVVAQARETMDDVTKKKLEQAIARAIVDIVEIASVKIRQAIVDADIETNENVLDVLRDIRSKNEIRQQTRRT